MRTVGEYTLLESMGPSELGEAFLSLGATHPVTRERHRCIIEILDPDVAADPERVEALFFEVGSARRLRFPGIDPVLGAGRSPEVWVSQPLEPGWTLTELIEMAEEVSDHLLVQVGIWIVARVAEALAGAHRHGLLHGALSPDSIRISPSATVHLRDLGLGSLLGGSERRLAYRAPELLTADLLTARADVYGLGMVLTTCLLGRPPFARRDPLSTRRAVLEHRFPVVRTVRRALAPRVDSLLAQMCALDPEERPPGPTEVLDLLEGLLGPSSDLVPAVLSRHLERMPKPRAADAEAAQKVRRDMGAATLGDTAPPVRTPRAPRAVSGRARIAGSGPEVPRRGEIDRFALERLVRVDGPIEEYDALDQQAGEPTRLRVLDVERAEGSS
ncbi:MAG: protein kinase, partial [Myxococcota bacterium]